MHRCRCTSSCQPGPLGQDVPAGGFGCPTCPHAAPIWHCSRWGLPCRFCCQPRSGLLPHRFTLTRACRERRAGAVSFLWRFPSGCPGRALPGTVALWSPDFPRHLAMPRPSGPPRGLGLGAWIVRVNGEACNQVGHKAQILRGQRPGHTGAKAVAKGTQSIF